MVFVFPYIEAAFGYVRGVPDIFRLRTIVRFYKRRKRRLLRRWIFERQTRVLQVRPSRVIDALPQVRRQTDYRGGSFVEIPIPDGDKQPDLRNPVQMLTVDRTSLDYNVEEEKRLRENIITAVVGQNEEVTQREAFNEQQVKAAFESQSTVLNRVKKGFEAAQQFVDETGLPIAIRQYVRICKSQLRHGVLFVRRKRVAEPLQVGKGKRRK